MPVPCYIYETASRGKLEDREILCIPLLLWSKLYSWTALHRTAVCMRGDNGNDKSKIKEG